MLVWTILRNLARKCGICGALVLVDVRCKTFFDGSCVVGECLSKPDCSFSDTPYYVRDLRSSSVLKMVFQVTPVLPKLRMSLLVLHHKGLAFLDLIVVTLLTTWSPVATERCWCRLMTLPFGVLALSPGRKWYRRIGNYIWRNSRLCFQCILQAEIPFWKLVISAAFICLCCTVQQVDTTVLIYRYWQQKIFSYPILTVCR
jgi:hypothetical protein